MSNRTDHSDAIALLREEAAWTPNGTVHNRLLAVAALLETHDATGISLEAFGPVGDFVNDVLRTHGLPAFTPNHV